MIQWLSQLSDISGLAISSPATGLIKPLVEHPDPIYSSNILPQAICIKLQQGLLYAPFNCQYSSHLFCGRRLRFKHQNGLSLQLDLPQLTLEEANHTIKQLVSNNSQVKAGQPIVRLDLQHFAHSASTYAVLMLLPHPAVTAVFSSERHVDAVKDNVMIIQIKSK